MEYTTLSNQPPDPNFPKTFVNSFSSCFEEKVNDKFISLDSNPKKKTNRKKLNSKSLKSLGLFSIPKEMIKYSLYLEMHSLWKEYMNQVHDLLKMELVGSIMTVLESKNITVIGTTGILVRESTNVFFIVTAQDKLVKIPKLNSIFTVYWKDSLIKIYGNNFRIKSTDRSSKRIKHNPTIELS